MRGSCVETGLRCGVLVALLLCCADRSPAGEVKLPKKEDWGSTLRGAPRYWDRNTDIAKQVIGKMRAYFPKARSEFFKLAADIGLNPYGNPVVQLWVVRQALAAGPKGVELERLKLAKAALHGNLVDGTTSLRLISEIDRSKLDKKTRKWLSRQIPFWKGLQHDILPIGRSFAAERLLREGKEFDERKEFKEAVVRYIKVMDAHPNGYFPLKNGAVPGSGEVARQRLAAIAREHSGEVLQGLEEAIPGLRSNAEEGDNAAMERVARLLPFTQVGWKSLVRLGERDLDAGRASLAALRFSRSLELAAGARSRSEALWRLAMAESLAGRGAASRRALGRLKGIRGGKVRVGDREVPAAEAAKLVERQLPVEGSSGATGTGIGKDSVLRPLMLFSSRPALFDLINRTAWWPRLWGRPESEPAFDGDRVFLHDSANMWAIDWRRRKFLWHYRYPEGGRRQSQRGRGYSNQIGEARQIGRGYGVGVVRDRVCARFRGMSANLWFELRCLSSDDGRVLWTSRGQRGLGGLSFASDPVGACDRFYALAFTPLHGSTAWLVCLDPDDGSVLWRTMVGSGMDSWGSDIGNIFSAHGGIAVSSGRVFLSSDRGCFACIDAVDGRLLWVSGIDRFFETGTWSGTRSKTTKADLDAVPERYHCRPVVGEKNVYCLAKDSTAMFALDLADGRRRFVQLPRTVMEVLGEHGETVVCAWHRGFFAMRTDDGEVAWERHLGLGSPWKSGFMRKGRIYWPYGGDVLIVDAADGRVLGKAPIKGSRGPVKLRPLPDGSLAAISTSGPVDHFSVLSAEGGKGGPVMVAEPVPGRSVDPVCLANAHPKAAGLAGVPVRKPPREASPPLELLWRGRFSPEEILSSGHYYRAIGEPQRLLVAAGSRLCCYRPGEKGELLWETPVGPGVSHVSPWSRGRVCVSWSKGFDLVDLSSGKWLWSWSGNSRLGRKTYRGTDRIWGATEISEELAVVWSRASFGGLTVPEGRLLWTHRIVPNAKRISATATPHGVLTFVRRDSGYGGNSYLQMLDPAKGKVKWQYNFPKNTYAHFTAKRVWGRSLKTDRLSMVEIGAKGAREVWKRNVKGGGAFHMDGDRILVRGGAGVTVLEAATGKDVLPAIKLSKTEAFARGGDVYVFSRRGTIDALDRQTGRPLWRQSLRDTYRFYVAAGQVFVRGERDLGSYAGYWSRYYQVRGPGLVHRMHSFDLKSGRPLGSFMIPSRGVDQAEWRNRGNNVMSVGGYLVLRTEGGAAVMGPAGMRPVPGLRGRLAELGARPGTADDERRKTMLRETLMRQAPPSVGAERCDSAPLLDGEFDDWRGATWTRLSSGADWCREEGGAAGFAERAWGGAKDCSVRFALRHDGSNLYLAAEVTDDDFSPPAGWPDLAEGDCVEVGIALTGNRADCLATGGRGSRRDLKVRFALVGGRAYAQRIYSGDPCRLAISSRPGRVRYEAMIPFSTGRQRPRLSDTFNISLRFVDADRGQLRGSMRWAGGLRGHCSTARFGSVVLAPYSNGDIADCLKVAGLLQDSHLGYSFLEKVVKSRLAHGDIAAARRDFAAFLRRSPGSYHASRCLAWCAHLDALHAGRPVAADPSRLFPELKIPELERREAAKRLYLKVRVPKGQSPDGVGLGLYIASKVGKRPAYRQVYWGTRAELMAAGKVWAGPLPKGEEFELSVPCEVVGLVNKVLTGVRFSQWGGAAGWGEFGLVDAGGKRQVLKTSAKPVASARLRSANYSLEQAGGRLSREACRKAVELVPDSQLVMDLLWHVQDPKFIADFVRRHPNGRHVPELLERLARWGGETLGGVPGKLIAERAVPRWVARQFNLRRAGSVSSWQVVGPFTNEADVALRRPYDPEKRPTLKATYKSGGRELSWKKASIGKQGYLELGTQLKASSFQCGYAMCWVKSEKAMRGWLFVSSHNVISAWLNEEQVLENAVPGHRRLRRRGPRQITPVPLSLKPGWNRLLVKCAARLEEMGFRLHIGTADASPLKGLKYSASEPESVGKL